MICVKTWRQQLTPGVFSWVFVNFEENYLTSVVPDQWSSMFCATSSSKTIPLPCIIRNLIQLILEISAERRRFERQLTRPQRDWNLQCYPLSSKISLWEFISNRPHSLQPGWHKKISHKFKTSQCAGITNASFLLDPKLWQLTAFFSLVAELCDLI